jgi:tetratricopeptide (TPR) repeat protein
VPRHTKYVVFALALAWVLPLLRAADDQWQNLSSLAVNATTFGDFGKADAIFARALHDAELFGKEGPRAATVLQAMAVLRRKEKRLPEAEESARHAVTIFGNNPGDQSMEFAQAQVTLSGVLLDEAKYQPALDAVNRALPIIQANSSINDVNLSDAICLQGNVYRLLKTYASAETPLKRCADMRADNNGVNTPEFGEAANSLALVYQHRGEYKEADRYFTYAAKIREVSLGIMSPALADTLEAHALLLRQLGRDAEAKDKEHMAATIRAHLGKK